jgi:hypothetical protein
MPQHHPPERPGRFRRRTVAALVAVGLAVPALIAGHAAAAEPGTARPGGASPVPVAVGPVQVSAAPATFAEPSTVAGTRVPGRFGGAGARVTSPGLAAGTALASEAVAPLTALRSPVAVTSPDGRFILYNTYVEARPVDRLQGFSQQGIRSGDRLGRPALRLKDAVDGTDRVFADGAASAAWSAAGRVAYVQGGDHHADRTWTGQVMVRDSDTAAPVRWSADAAYYLVIGWAGDVLLAYRQHPGEQLELLAFDGPMRSRTLGPGTLVAVSPDGTQAFLEQASSAGTVTTVDVATGRRLAKLDVRNATTPIDELVYGGDWRGDFVVAQTADGAAVFAVRGGSISVHRLVEVDPARYPFGMGEPELADDSGDAVFGWARLMPVSEVSAPPTAVLRCDAGGCLRGSLHAERSVHPLRNPSRPMTPTGGTR